MSDIPKHISECLSKGKKFDLTDPYIKKILKEIRQEKKQAEVEHRQQEKHLKNEYECWREESGIKKLEYEYKNFLQQEFLNKHTIDWNYPKKCKWCDCESMRIIERPDSMHYAEYSCNVCYKNNGWLPYK